jgi:hypothetical protein
MKNDPAFPTETPLGFEDGMSLRDYFAAKAMQGLITQFAHGFEPDTVDGFSAISYRIADSMMEAREK